MLLQWWVELAFLADLKSRFQVFCQDQAVEALCGFFSFDDMVRGCQKSRRCCIICVLTPPVNSDAISFSCQFLMACNVNAQTNLSMLSVRQACSFLKLQDILQHSLTYCFSLVPLSSQKTLFLCTNPQTAHNAQLQIVQTQLALSAQLVVDKIEEVRVSHHEHATAEVRRM